MSRVVVWLQNKEIRLFFFINHKLQHSLLQALVNILTHIGGATCTIVTTLSFAVFTHGSLSNAGWRAFAALAGSHLLVAVIKHAYPRLRPYLVLPKTVTGTILLKDHSFPSGHTTAIFASVTPFAVTYPLSGLALYPLAAFVGFSRIYLGLHYPSDCVAGAVIGIAAGLLSILCGG